MPQITLDNAKNALATAFTMWLDQNPSGFQVNCRGALVNIIYNRVGNRLDFGFPSNYTLAPNEVPPLTAWWRSQRQSNVMQPAQLEPASGLLKINAMVYPFNREKGVTLNFHISLTATR